MLGEYVYNKHVICIFAREMEDSFKTKDRTSTFGSVTLLSSQKHSTAVRSSINCCRYASLHPKVFLSTFRFCWNNKKSCLFYGYHCRLYILINIIYKVFFIALRFFAAVFLHFSYNKATIVAMVANWCK